MQLYKMPTNSPQNRTGWFVTDILLGVLGLSMPLIVWLLGTRVFGTGLQPSLSDYYHTPLGGLHVGAFLVFAVYFTARPWPTLTDHAAGLAVGVFTAGAALIPVSPCVAVGDSFAREADLSSLLHLISAFFLLATFAYLMFFRFGKNRVHSRQSRVFHRTLAVVMLMCSTAIAGFGLFGETCHTAQSTNSEVFWLEAIALSTFWISWLVECLEGRKSVPH